MELSVVIPVFNEQENVLPLASEVAEALKDYRLPFEIVFVDDASKDSTWEKIQEARRIDPRVRGVRHHRNLGQSAAVWTGVQQTKAPLLATLDGDRQNDPADLPKLIAEVALVDFTCGVRLNRKDTWIKRTSSKIARCFRHWMLGADFRDTGCALRVFRRTALSQVLVFRGWHRFMPILVHNAGFTVKEVPVNHRPRAAGISKYGIGNRLWVGIYDLIGIAWYQRRRVPVVKPTDISLTQ